MWLNPMSGNRAKCILFCQNYTYVPDVLCTLPIKFLAVICQCAKMFAPLHHLILKRWQKASPVPPLFIFIQNIATMKFVL